MDESCPVCRTADVVCGKWTLLLVRDLAEGRSRFCELERSLAGISPRTLSLRLRALEDEGIVDRQTYAEVPPRVEYALTAKGLALLPIIDGMREYGTRWLGAEACEGDRAARSRSRGRLTAHGRAATPAALAGSCRACEHGSVQALTAPRAPLASARCVVRRSPVGVP